MSKSEKYYRAYLEHNQISRRGLLRGLFNGLSQRPTDLSVQRWVLRPPGAVDEGLFLAKCNQCGECVKACPLSMIHIEENYPVLDFSGTYCDECQRCTQVCQHGALVKSVQFDTGARPVLSHYCKNNRIPCHICAENCQHEAIIWQPSAAPEIDADRCNGCGRCYFSCDSKAWSMQAKISSS